MPDTDKKPTSFKDIAKLYQRSIVEDALQVIDPELAALRREKRLLFGVDVDSYHGPSTTF